MMINRRSPPSTADSPCKGGTKPRTRDFIAWFEARVSERHENDGQAVPTATL